MTFGRLEITFPRAHNTELGVRSFGVHVVWYGVVRNYTWWTRWVAEDRNT